MSVNSSAHVVTAYECPAEFRTMESERNFTEISVPPELNYKIL